MAAGHRLMAANRPLMSADHPLRPARHPPRSGGASAEGGEWVAEASRFDLPTVAKSVTLPEPQWRTSRQWRPCAKEVMIDDGDDAER